MDDTRLSRFVCSCIHTTDTDKTRQCYLVRVDGVNTTTDKKRQFCLVPTCIGRFFARFSAFGGLMRLVYGDNLPEILHEYDVYFFHVEP